MGIEVKYNIERRLKSAKDFENSGLNLHAIQIYTSILHDNIEIKEAVYSLVEIFEKQGNINPAKKIFASYLNENPEDNFMRLYNGQFLLRNDLWEEVIDVVQSVDINEEPVTGFFLGYSYFMLKNYELAKINFQNFIEAGEKTELFHEACIYLAKTEIELRNFESALAYAKKSEPVYSNFWELNLVFAIIHHNLNMHIHAVSSISKAIKLNSADPRVNRWAGKIFLKAGEYLKAEKYFLNYMEMVEDPPPEDCSELGEVLLKTNNISDAIHYYRLALKYDPHNKFAARGMKIASSILESGSNEK